MIALVAFGLLLPSHSAVVGAVLYWDTNGAVAGCGTGSGDWLASNWSTDSAGTLVTGSWTDSSDPVFSAGSDATGALAISTAGGNVFIGNLTVEEGDVDILGSGYLGIAGNRTWTVNPGASLSIASNISNPNGRTLTIHSLGDTILSGDLAGYGGLSMTGTGSLTVAGSKAFRALNLSSGRLNIANAAAVGTRITISGGTIDNVSGNAATLTTSWCHWDGSFTMAGTADGTHDLHLGTGAVTLNTSPTVTVDGGTLTVGGAIAGGYGLTKAGAGTMVFAGAGTFIGPLTIAAGRLQIGDGGSTGSVTSDIVNHASLVFNRSGALAYAGAISGVGSVTQSGDGTVILSGNNSYSGGTTVAAGLLRFNAVGSLPDVGLITVDIGGYVGANSDAWGSDLQTGFLAKLDAADCQGVIGLESDTAIPIDMSAFGPNARLGSAVASTFTGTLTPKANVYRVGGGGGSLTIGSNLADVAGATSLEMGTSGNLAPGMVLLTGNNSYSGGTMLAAGTLDIQADGSLGATSGPVHFTGSATLQTGATIVVLGSQRNIILGSGAIGSFDTQDNIMLVAGAVDGDGTLEKTGTGTLYLVNPGNTYRGGTILTAGQLAVSEDGNLGGSTGAIHFAGGILQIYGTQITTIDGHPVNWDTFDGGFHVVDPAHIVTIGQTIGGGGNLTKLGPGTLVLENANTFTGVTSIGDGTLALGNPLALQGSTLDASGAGTLDVGTATAITLGGLQGSNVFSLENNLGAAIAVSVGNSGSDTTFAGVLRGKGSLVKVGAGKLTLSNVDSDYSGGTTLGAGTLNINADGALGAAGPLGFTGDATLQAAAPLNLGEDRTVSLGPGVTGTFDTQSHAVSIAGPIVGEGNLSKRGAGILTLAGTNTYSGDTVVNEGILSVDSGSRLGTGAAVSLGGGTLRIAGTTGFITTKSLTVAGASTVDVSNPAGAVWAGNIDGNARLTKTGSGTLTLNGLANLTTSEGSLLVGGGTVVVPTGSVEADNIGINGSGSKLTLSGGSLDLGNGLSVGGSSGAPCTFEMTGGTLTCAETYAVGSGDNTPSIFQSGGTAVADTLRVGVRYTNTATYNLSGTAVLLSREAIIGGDHGTGHFVQTGGTHAVTENMTVGYASTYSFTQCYYQLDDGSLTTSATFLGNWYGEGYFQQNGGVFDAGFLGVKATCSYTMRGGQLIAMDSAYVSGTFDLGSSANSISVAGIANLSGATIVDGAATTFSVAPESLVIFPTGFDPNTRFQSFSNNGLVANLGGGVNIPLGRTVKGSGTIADHVYCAGSLLHQADYTVPNQSFLSNNSINPTVGITVDGGVVHLGSTSKLTVNDQVSGITGGELQAATIWMGYNANGRFVQEGGTVTTDDMMLGNGSSNSKPKPQVSYEISGGSLTVTNDLAVAAYRSIADFVQTGGSVTVGDELLVGTSYDGPHGAYRISGGSLSAGAVRIAHGSSVGVLEVVGDDAVIHAGQLTMSDEAQLISHVEGDGLSTIELSQFAQLRGIWQVCDDHAPLGYWDVITAAQDITTIEWTVELPNDNWSWGIDDGNTLWVQHVPEPSIFILLGIGTFVLLGRYPAARAGVALVKTERDHVVSKFSRQHQTAGVCS